VVKESVVEVSAGEMDFEQLEVGYDMQVQVAGFSGPPSDSDSRILSYGQSGTFKVPKEKVADQPAAKVLVFFRQVETFSPSTWARSPPSAPTWPRRAPGTPPPSSTTAGSHRRRLRHRGPVAGQPEGPQFWHYKDTVEIFDPATGEIASDIPPMTRLDDPTPRAFHTASWKVGNQVLIAGGEYVDNKGGGCAATPSSRTPSSSTPPSGRRAVGAAALARDALAARGHDRADGIVLLYGGLSFDGTSTTRPSTCRATSGTTRR
jgi:hypothetical protein